MYCTYYCLHLSTEYVAIFFFFLRIEITKLKTKYANKKVFSMPQRRLENWNKKEKQAGALLHLQQLVSRLCASQGFK